MFKRQKMLAPFGVDGLQQDLFFDHAHGFGTKGSGLSGHHFIGGLFKTLGDFLVIHALFGGPVDDRQIKVKPLDHRLIKPFGVPLVGIGLGRHVGVDQIVDHLAAHVLDDLGQITRLHDIKTLLEDHFALFVHHIVELEQLLADVEVARLDLGLRAFKRFVHPGVNDRLALFHPQRREHFFQTFTAENAHQIVFEAQEKGRLARIALTTGATAQLVVDTAAFMALGGQHEKPARSFDSLFIGGMALFDLLTNLFGIAFGIGGDCLHDLELDIAAKFDIGAAPGHVGGDGHRAEFAGIGDDLGLFFMLTRVQNVMRNLCLGQKLAQQFRLFNRGGAHQGRLTLFMRFADRLDDRVKLVGGRAVHRIILVDPCNRAIGRHFDHAKTVDFQKFFGLGSGGAGHARESIVKPEIVLKGYLCEGHVLWLNLTALLGLDRLMQPLGQTPTGHHPAGEFVNQNDVAIAHDVILVLLEKLVRAQPLIDVMHNRGAFRIIKRTPLFKNATRQQKLFKKFVALFGEGYIAGLFINREMIVLQFRDQRVDCQVKLAAVLAWAGNDQRRARLVDQDAVHLIDHGKVMAALIHLFERGFHVVAQIIEPKLVIGGIGHIGGIGGLFLGLGLLRIDDAGGHAEGGKHLAHPIGIATRKIVVDRNHVNAPPRQRIEI